MAEEVLNEAVRVRAAKHMLRYDPQKPPDPEEWLAADEGERIKAAEAWHRNARVKVPREKLHAVIHVIVENQIAGRLQAVERAMPRLAREGLDRHDCIHAIGWVLALHLHDMFASASEDTTEETNARYAAAVERLSAQAWREQKGP